MAVANSTPCLLDAHLQRMRKGCSVLGIPLDIDAMVSDIETLAQDQEKAVIRATLTMGEGGRGYLTPEHPQATRIVSLHPYPKHPSSYWENGIELGVVDIRLASQPALAGIKHGNRLEQTIARSQWHSNWHEALALDQQDNVIEGTQSNVFIVRDGELATPGLNSCGVLGVMRETIIDSAHKLGIRTQLMSLSLADVQAADEVFMTNSVIGVWPVKCLNSASFNTFKISHKLLKYIIENEVIPNYKA